MTNQQVRRDKHMRRTRTALQVMAAAALMVSAQAFVNPSTAGSHSGNEVSLATRTPTRTANAISSSKTSTAGQPTCLFMGTDMDMEKQEFEMQVGRALDTLRSDYPDMLKHAPDYSIYDPKLVVVDPSGFHLEGISNYKQAFNLVHSILNVFYCPEKSLLTNRMIYDCTRNNIRVSWNAEIVPKAIFGTKNTLHVDGISVYDLNSQGKVMEHRVEHLMINDRPVETERGIFHALRQECDRPDCSIPVFSKVETDDAMLMRFVLPTTAGPSKSLLFSNDMDNSIALHALSASSGTDEYPNLDWDAFRKKNATRKKFGLDPLTPEEFLDIEEQVQQMTAANNAANDGTATTPPPPRKKKEKNLLANLFGNAFEDTCESNFDCKRPQVCCDFGFKKTCCSSGAMVGQMQQQPVRIPVTKDDGYNKGW